MHVLVCQLRRLCELSWIITTIILRCTVNKTSLKFCLNNAIKYKIKLNGFEGITSISFPW